MSAIATPSKITETLLDGNNKEYTFVHNIVRWTPKTPTLPIEVEYEGKGKWSGGGYVAITD